MGSICQIGAVRFEGGREVASVSWLVDPCDYFDPIHVGIHGINKSVVAGQPKFAERYGELRSFTDDSIVVSHTHFDRVSLTRACTSGGHDELNCRWLDSALVARRAWSDVACSGFGLASLAQRLGIDFRHHDAVEDARVAGLILLRAIEETARGLDDWLVRVKQPIAGSTGMVRRTGDGDGSLVSESLVFTGALNIPRGLAADRAHRLGAAVEPGVTKHTTLLVVGDQDLSKLKGHSKSTKHRKAESLIQKGQAIRILAESDFMAFEDE